MILRSQPSAEFVLPRTTYYNPSSSRYLCVFFRQSRRKYLVDKQLSRLAGIPKFCILILAF